MGVYRDNLSAIVIGDNFLSINVIAQNSLNLSINDFLCTQCFNFKVSELTLWKNTRCPLRLVEIFKNYFFVWLNFTAESVNCSLFLKNLEKTSLQFDLQKIYFVKHIVNLPQHLSEKFIGDNLSIIDIALRN